MSNVASPQLNELVTFLQHKLPGLPDGAYQLALSQEVKDGEKVVSDGSLNANYTFAVLGDRFALGNPAETVNSVFPSDNATGAFTNVLPHVVFSKQTLPWSRSPEAKALQLPQAGLDAEKGVPTWLAVLTFDEDDQAAYPGLTLPLEDATIGDLFPPSVYAQSTLDGNYSYFWQAKNTSDLEPGQTVNTAIQVIDIPLELFWQVAPTLEDLKLTAHVRQVKLDRKPTGQGANPETPLGTYAIVFGTRLPQNLRKSYSCVVSLEGLEPFLPTNENGGQPSGSSFDPSRKIRLALLRSWTFYSAGQPAMFVDALLELNGRPPDSKTDAANTNLRLNYPGSNAVIKSALEMGFAPIDEKLRNAGRTVSWYRGPLVPYAMPARGLKFPIDSPDKVTSYDPTTGMLDVSYGAAWTIGRLLALEDTAFSTEFYNWKRGLSQAIIDAIEDDILNQKFGTLGTAASVQPFDDGSRPARALLRRTVHALIRGE